LSEAYVLNLKGTFYVNYAWQARGDGPGATITPKGSGDFADRLKIAGELLTRASDLDPDFPDPATEMLSVVMGEGGDRDTMEKWFKRAIAIDPDNRTACESYCTWIPNGMEMPMPCSNLVISVWMTPTSIASSR
jgi:hypothetical protein